MKLIKITSMALLAGSMIASTGCVRNIDEFGDTNTDPGRVAEPITAALFTNALASIRPEILSGPATLAGLYAQHISETQYTENSRYARQNPDFSAYYSTVLYDLQNIINFNGSNPGKAAAYGSNANQIATARILKAWWFLRVVDAWGDLPYSQALKLNGVVPYDNQQAIYNDLFKELKEAAAQFDGGPAFQGDILLDGDISAWKKFANSLRLMMAVRIAKVDANKGKTEALDAIAGGVLTSYTEDVELVPPGGNYPNPWYEYYNITQRRDFGLSSTLTAFMNPVTPVFAPNGNNDKRVFAYGSASSNGLFVKGFDYGLTRTDAIAFANANPDWARVISNNLRTATLFIPVLTASQVWLARAEAAQLGWTAENAKTAYENGIREGWRQWGVYNQVDFDAYIADYDINFDLKALATPTTAADKMSRIFRQRWIAAFPDGQEAWNVWREANGNGNNYLVLAPAPGSGLQIPRRLGIAQNQFDLNPTNTQAVAAAYTVNGEIDSQYARVWWDKP